MIASGEPLGIKFDFGGYVGNSFESLRLIHWISKNYPEKQEPLIALLSKNHFENRLCVGSKENLTNGMVKSTLFYFISLFIYYP